jgi:RNA polymerase sigma-70 factor, ECF subfamily
MESGILELVRDYRRKVFGLAYSYLRNREAAEDVTQEVFIKIWRALSSYDGRASMSTWIYTITRNASLSALRTQRTHASLSDPEVMEEVDQATDAPGDAAVDAAALMRMVDTLPSKQRQVVMLFYMQEQSHEEVAAMLAMPIGTVKTLLHRARARLGELA